MIRPVPVLKEAVASAMSTPVAALLTMLVVAVMVLSVMLTAGRTVGTERRVLASIDSATSRAIVIRASPEAGVTTEVLSRLAGVEGIEWAGAFSGAVDATNARVPDGLRVPTRQVFSTNLGAIGLADAGEHHDLVFASEAALSQLGMPDSVGEVRLDDDSSAGIGGRLNAPDFLADFEPLILMPRAVPSDPQAVAVVMVIADSPALVPIVSDLALSVLDPVDSSKVNVQTSESLEELKILVQSQLGASARGILLALLGLTGVLVAVILSGLVMLRRKDFGRRRALGASRRLIVVLLVVQTALLAAIGVAAGVSSGLVALVVTRDPLPDPAFTTALCVLTFVTTVTAAIVPAAVASRREPIRELRLP